MLIASGPGIRSGARIEGATIYDVAPTILHAMGMPLGKDMDGRVLKDLFAGELAARADRVIDTWDTAGTGTEASPEIPADVDQKMLEHMRSLGYIDQ